ncbi:MAG TPA: FGGY family carbohydrate kinase [Streptosporangiaceae bacterium]|nr:FGGY family carbohydrate kinase [Streptosporangiaceae bacterium]
MNVLAIDQGTSATKALLVGPGNEVLGTGAVPVRTRTVGADGVEADPEELFASVLAAGRAALANAGAPAHAVALANQGETVLAWDRATGTPLTPAIVWQDRRAATVCDRLRDQRENLTAITGLPLDPYFAAPKMTWLRENMSEDGVVTMTDTWLLHQLGAGYVTDAATASRTMLLDLDAATWSETACAAFGLSPETLPAVTDCAGVVGETTLFGNRSLPVAGIAVDQQAALLAEGCLTAGDAKCTYGTGAFLLVTTGTKAARSSSGLSASVAWRLGEAATYCLDGQVYTAGSALRWLTSVGLLDSPDQLDVVAGAVPDSGGVTFVPALAGLGAPHWAPDSRGAFTGLRLGTERGHLVRAVAEGIAASVALLVSAAVADLGAPLSSLRVDGGLTRSRLLMQAQADLLQIPVQVCRSPDATALGVAALARLGVGAAGSVAEAVGPAELEMTVDPSIPPDEAAERAVVFRAAVDASLARR